MVARAFGRCVLNVVAQRGVATATDDGGGHGTRRAPIGAC
jgi:hypothetical protein